MAQQSIAVGQGVPDDEEHLNCWPGIQNKVHLEIVDRFNELGRRAKRLLDGEEVGVRVDEPAHGQHANAADGGQIHFVSRSGHQGFGV